MAMSIRMKRWNTRIGMSMTFIINMNTNLTIRQVNPILIRTGTLACVISMRIGRTSITDIGMFSVRCLKSCLWCSAPSIQY